MGYSPLLSSCEQPDESMIQYQNDSESHREYVAITSNDPSTPTHAALLNKLKQEIESFPLAASLTSSSDKPRTASLTSSIITFTSSIIGAGTLGMPFAMSKAGIVVGLALILFFAGLAIISLYFLMYCGKHFPGHSSFYSLSIVFLPKPLQSMMDVAVILACLG
eukprot:36806_1